MLWIRWLAASLIFFLCPLSAYPHVEDNPYLSLKVCDKISDYLLPLAHPLKPVLDEIFSASRVTRDEESLAEAGFVTLFAQPHTFIRVVRHPELPGVLIKLYLDNETRQKEGVPGWRWLVQRCQGAEAIRNLILRKKLRYFSVPDKGIYPLPPHENSSRNPIVLVVEDMELVPHKKSVEAWKKAGPDQLDELYCILSHGYSSNFLPWNIPMTKKGKFSCIDTEHPYRKINLKGASPFFSEKMRVYWNKK